MPNATVRADATGLPETSAVLAEADRARSSRRGFLRSGAMAALFGATAVATAATALEPRSDAELIRLGDELMQAFHEWREAEDAGDVEIYDPALDRMCAIEDLVHRAPVRTMAGLRAKAVLALTSNIRKEELEQIDWEPADRDWGLKCMMELIADIERLTKEARA